MLSPPVRALRRRFFSAPSAEPVTEPAPDPLADRAAEAECADAACDPP